MKIIKKHIRKVENYLSDMNQDSKFILGVRLNSRVSNIIFSQFDSLNDNKLFIPKPYIGKISQRNTIGEFVPDKSKPKEIAYRAHEWTLKDWGGNWHSGISEDPYKRYPRIFKKPKNLKFRYISEKNIKLFIIDKKFINNKKEYDDIKFAINLFLEIFAEVETFVINQESQKIEPIKETVSWKILPKGERIWEVTVKGKSHKLVSKSESKKINERFEYIKRFKPDTIYQGLGGYTGYLVFEFKKEKIYVFDSVMYGNATYIFNKVWKEVSKLTKKEILEGHLEEKRIIHSNNWKNKLKDTLEKENIILQ
ncbi:hypothetical protein PT285_07685 [Lactobacillus sp. ESL0791]|uniref:hypothetical protein n=1 Tax=Lactobacillus sp. ESL0791 TaxID=2983234 RepID=UPI0023F6DC85|nr:hypothetical protein [Lactobacillus sp. ESL0791]MDF7639280.1 hypothetical protein [Lactobacillus sp. ESL0791]